MKITINLSETTFARLVEYAHNEVGSLPEVAAQEILTRFFAEDYEVDADGDLIADYGQLAPEYRSQIVPARWVELEYNLKPGTVRSYARSHPELILSGALAKIDGRTWGVRREAAEEIWGSR